jgi:hypothetical protein
MSKLRKSELSGLPAELALGMDSPELPVNFPLNLAVCN